jgi:hypothetical protein
MWMSETAGTLSFQGANPRSQAFRRQVRERPVDKRIGRRLSERPSLSFGTRVSGWMAFQATPDQDFSHTAGGAAFPGCDQAILVNL